MAWPGRLSWLLVLGASFLVAACGGGTLYAPLDSGRGNWLMTGGAEGGPSAVADGPRPPLQLLWSHRIGAPPVGGGLLAGSVLLQPTQDEKMFAFDLASGERLGRRGSKAPICGPSAIIGRAGDAVLTSEAGRKSHVRSYDRRSGDIVWEVKTQACAPVSGRDDTALVVTGGGHLLALSAAAGEQLWSASLPHYPTTGAILSANLAIVGGADGAVMAVDLAEGTILWDVSLKTSGAAVRGQPLATTQQIFVTTADGGVWCLDRDGELTWSARIGGLPASGLAVIGETLIVGSSDRGVYAFNTNDGQQRWRFEADGIVRGAPAVTDHIVYVATSSGNLVALSLESGEQIWSYELDGAVQSPVVLARDLLSVTTQAGTVYLFAAQSAIR